MRPVKQDEARCTVTDAEGDHVFIKHRDTVQVLRVLAIGMMTVKLLLIQLDQGSQGAAGVAFVESTIWVG